MTIIDGECWKCHSEMKVAIWEVGKDSDWCEVNLDIDNIAKSEIEFAKSKGVIIKEHLRIRKYSIKKTLDRILANTCPKCKSFSGNSYLSTYFLLPAKYGELNSKVYPLEFYCEDCEGKL